MTRTCAHCRQDFEIPQEDLTFLEQVSPLFAGKKELIPPPTLCPDCRFQRRLSMRNLRHLSHRTCDKTGKAIISCYRADSPHTVYHSTEWWGDGWDGLDYGREFDFTRPFFEQFQELYHAVPVVHQYATNDIENCEYVNGVGHCKNCYLCFMLDYCEDCYYISYAERARSCLDCLGVVNCELCAECIDCRDGYRLLYSQRCIGCSDSAFLSDCLRCKNCIGCTNLTDKEYHVFNKPCSPEEFARQKALLLSGANVDSTLERFRAWSATTPKKCYFGSGNEDVSGDAITHAKNSRHCFDVAEVENCRYCNYVFKADNCMDYHVYGDHSSWIYECAATGTQCSNDAFCLCCWSGSSNNLYCHLINACRDCFGCSGLKSQRYCILNKQYSKEDYEALVPRIIAHMRKRGEWGEYFPTTMAPCAYNDSEAQELFPLTREHVLARGWRWEEGEADGAKYLGPVTVIPQAIADVPDAICSKILQCAVTGKPYKIIPQELALCRELGIPIARKCPEQRHAERMSLRNPRRLWSRPCAQCGKNMETTYAPDRPETVYCEACYLQLVR